MDSIEKDQPKTSNTEAAKDTDATKKETEEPSFTIDSEETPSFLVIWGTVLLWLGLMLVPLFVS